MGKIVKYCAACEESFAEKFAFCPNCAEPLSAFEMNPVNSGEPAIVEKAAPLAERIVPIIEPKKAVVKNDILEVPAIAAIAAKPIAAETAANIEIPNIAATKVFPASNQTQTYNLADIKELESPNKAETEEIAEDNFIPETKTFAAAAGANDNQYQANNFQPYSNTARKADDDGYHITVIEEKNGRQRNGLLLGTMVVMVVVVLSSAVYSIFNKDFGIGEIDSDNPVFLAVIDDVPFEVEKEQPKKDDDDGGGGGGGGRKEETPTSQGKLAPQTEKPLIAPTKTIVQKDFELKQPIASTQGNKPTKPTEGPYGDPNSKYTLSSDGTGSGGGQGSGTGTGQGSGRGTGQGSGLGSGSGSGNGDGNGGGTGSGSGVPRPPPPPPEPKPVGPTEALKIISKPSPKYTDAARQNQVTGTVTLKITFTASGQIGSIAPVSGLPYGLTEQAIAAARQIRFEPPKRNGVPYGVSKTVSYTFTIY
ncbi:MAG: energy transducer TonB [Pyrinomonadaceae bacterium]|nr:energy transducer TonB [Pyrinomonadaceae bacterium]